MCAAPRHMDRCVGDRDRCVADAAVRAHRRAIGSALVIAAVVAGVVAVVESVVVAGEEEKRGWRSDGVCNGRWWGVSEWTE